MKKRIVLYGLAIAGAIYSVVSEQYHIFIPLGIFVIVGEIIFWSIENEKGLFSN